MESREFLGGGNLSLYILKALCACLVVFIHIPGISKEVFFVLPLLRIAVPCFYMISGFYLVCDGELSRKRIGRQIPKILWVLVFFNAIYLLYGLFFGTLRPRTVFAWEFLAQWLLWGDNICYPFWYLTAYLQTLLILWISAKTNLLKYWPAWGPVLLIAGVLLNRYSFLLFDGALNIHVSRNLLFCALPCVSCGAYLRRYTDRNTLSPNVLTCVSVVLLLAYAELFLLGLFDFDGSGADFNLMTYPLAIAVFLVCVRYRAASGIPEKVRLFLVRIGEEHAADIYLYHILVYSILVSLTDCMPYARYLKSAEVVIGICLIFSVLKKRLNAKFLSHLI